MIQKKTNHKDNVYNIQIFHEKRASEVNRKIAEQKNDIVFFDYKDSENELKYFTVKKDSEQTEDLEFITEEMIFDESEIELENHNTISIEQNAELVYSAFENAKLPTLVKNFKFQIIIFLVLVSISFSFTSSNAVKDIPNNSLSVLETINISDYDKSDYNLQSNFLQEDFITNNFDLNYTEFFIYLKNNIKLYSDEFSITNDIKNKSNATIYTNSPIVFYVNFEPVSEKLTEITLIAPYDDNQIHSNKIEISINSIIRTFNYKSKLDKKIELDNIDHMQEEAIDLYKYVYYNYKNSNILIIEINSI